MRGLLLIQSGYPGVLEEAGLVRVEIFRLTSEEVWETLDRYEGYRPELGYRSLFYRKQVSLLQPRIRTWVYFLGREVPRGTPNERAARSQRFLFSGIALNSFRIDTR